MTQQYDDSVSAGYRAFASESVPAKLDDIVLKEAAAAATPKRSTDWSSWILRPATIVASLGISLAVVLQLTDTSFVSTPIPVDSSVQQKSASNAVVAETQSRDAVQAGGNGDPSRSRHEEPERTSTTLQAEPERASITSSELAAAAADSAENVQKQKIMVSPSSAKQSLDSAAPQAADSTAINLVSEAKIQRVVRHCDADVSSSASDWFNCIERLEQAGRLANAKTERKLLQAAFPDFEIAR